jgi:hypothetical protein
MLGRSYHEKCEACWERARLRPLGLPEARHSFVIALVRAGYDIKSSAGVGRPR